MDSQWYGYVVILCTTHEATKTAIAYTLSQTLNCPWIRGEAAHHSAEYCGRLQLHDDDDDDGTQTVAFPPPPPNGNGNGNGNGIRYGYSEIYQRIWAFRMARAGFELPRAGMGMGTGRRMVSVLARSLDRSVDAHGSGSGDGQDSRAESSMTKNSKTKPVVPNLNYLAVLSADSTRRRAREAIREVLAGHGVKPVFVILKVEAEPLPGHGWNPASKMSRTRTRRMAYRQDVTDVEEGSAASGGEIDDTTSTEKDEGQKEEEMMPEGSDVYVVHSVDADGEGRHIDGLFVDILRGVRMMTGEI